MTRIKICGITQEKDAVAAVALGADALGFIFAKSPRRTSLVQAKKICAALPPFISKVGVFVNAGQQDVLKAVKYCGLDTIQLHGDESDKYCAFFKKYCKIIKAFRVKDKSVLKVVSSYKNVDAFLFDAYDPECYGGTGKIFAHDLLKNVKFSKPIIISGGINPENVEKIISLLMPYAIDVSSAVEKQPGIKDLKKLKALISAVKMNV
ncbi:MAG: phosphoribosylanthranilate isomerase [Candidatus Omnitrophica bacterium]|nr:phosphoribosylanthranilate isomerase [Candidatus Omnitrophota bacterium]